MRNILDHVKARKVAYIQDKPVYYDYIMYYIKVDGKNFAVDEKQITNWL